MSHGLAKLNALITARLVAGSTLSVFRLDSFSVRAIIVIVMNITMFGRVFQGVGVVRRDFCHWVDYLLNAMVEEICGKLKIVLDKQYKVA